MTKKIKLVFFHPYSSLGGADNSLGRLIANLDKKFFSITFVSLKKSVLQNKLNKEVEFINLNSNRALLSIIKMRRILEQNIQSRKFKKIILISNQNFANIISSLSSINLQEIKKIFIERNHLDELDYYEGFSKFIKRKIIKILMKFTYRKADKIVAICKELSQDLCNHVKRSVITIYSPSIDKEIIKLQNSKINYKFFKKKTYIINVSRFSEYKGQMDILRATKPILKYRNNIRLILIGYGEYKKELLKFININKIKSKVKIIDNCYNPYPYIKKSNLFIFSSNYEGFPNVINEALMLNTPVISSNCKSGPKEMLLNGKGGDFYPKKDYIRLRKLIENYLKNPKKLENKMKIARKQLWKFTIGRHVKLYHKLFFNI